MPQIDNSSHVPRFVVFWGPSGAGKTGRLIHAADLLLRSGANPYTTSIVSRSEWASRHFDTLLTKRCGKTRTARISARSSYQFSDSLLLPKQRIGDARSLTASYALAGGGEGSSWGDPYRTLIELPRSHASLGYYHSALQTSGLVDPAVWYRLGHAVQTPDRPPFDHLVLDDLHVYYDWLLPLLSGELADLSSLAAGFDGDSDELHGFLRRIGSLGINAEVIQLPAPPSCSPTRNPTSFSLVGVSDASSLAKSCESEQKSLVCLSSNDVLSERLQIRLALAGTPFSCIGPTSVFDTSSLQAVMQFLSWQIDGNNDALCYIFKMCQGNHHRWLNDHPRFSLSRALRSEFFPSEDDPNKAAFSQIRELYQTVQTPLFPWETISAFGKWCRKIDRFFAVHVTEELQTLTATHAFSLEELRDRIAETVSFAPNTSVTFATPDAIDVGDYSRILILSDQTIASTNPSGSDLYALAPSIRFSSKSDIYLLTERSTIEGAINA